MRKSAALKQARGLGPGPDVPIEQAYDVSTKVGRISGDLAGRDYFFNFTE